MSGFFLSQKVTRGLFDEKDIVPKGKDYKVLFQSNF